MTTFSQLVDELLSETKRPDLRDDIARYVNQTIRECHFTPGNGAVVPYRENLREVLITANAEEGFGWEIPDPATFQFMQAVRYNSIYTRDAMGVYAHEKLPSRAAQLEPYWFYRAGSNFFFSGYGGLNAVVALAYYEYPRRLKYYIPSIRPANYDPEIGWTYHTDYFPTEELRLAARSYSTNWLLFRWHDVVAEGVRAKVYKRVSDEVRMKASYSLYQQLRQGLYTSEVAELGGPV